DQHAEDVGRTHVPFPGTVAGSLAVAAGCHDASNATGISGSCRLAARAAPSGGAIIPAAMQGSQAVRIRTERKGETQASAQQCCTQHAIPFPALCRSQHWRGDALWMGEMQQFAAESHIFHVGNTIE